MTIVFIKVTIVESAMLFRLQVTIKAEVITWHSTGSRIIYTYAMYIVFGTHKVEFQIAFFKYKCIHI
jgi:hypothetical protein